VSRGVNGPCSERKPIGSQVTEVRAVGLEVSLGEFLVLRAWLDRYDCESARYLVGSYRSQVYGKESVLSKYSSRVVIRLEEEKHAANVGGGQHQKVELHAEC
jgi:hypothetical protein